jgi:hypothetical protein
MNNSPSFRLLLLTLAIFSMAIPSFAQKKKRVDPLAIPQVTRDQVICFALYTVHERTLKLTAQLYPLKEGESREATLEVKRGGDWKKVAEAKVIERGWTVPFRVEKWDDSQETPYRVRHGEKATYEGIIRKNPTDKQEFVTRVNGIPREPDGHELLLSGGVLTDDPFIGRLLPMPYPIGSFLRIIPLFYPEGNSPSPLDHLGLGHLFPIPSPLDFKGCLA